MHAPDVDDDGAVFRECEVVDFVFLGNTVDDAEGKDGTPAVGFFDDHVDVREGLEVGPLWGAVRANDLVDFGVG